MSANTIITSVVTGGTNSHATIAEEANAIATDFITQGVVGIIGLNTGSGGSGSFCVNADASPDMGVTIKAGQAYITATPSSQDSQVLRARAAADYTAYTINANASGSTKYDWIYLSVSATNANTPSSTADNVASLVTSRSSSNTADNGTPPTYGLLLAIVTVANGASSITNSNITDARVNASMGGVQGGLFSGWVAASETWVYASYDSTNKTGTITVPTDATTKYSNGMRVKFTNNGTTQYGIITKVAATVLTVYFGTDYSLTNATITSNYYSPHKAPFAFPLDPTKWTVTTTDTANNTQSNPTASTWYNVGSLSITVPIGAWKLSHLTTALVKTNTAQTLATIYATLSTANNSESDNELTGWNEIQASSAQLFLGIRTKIEKRVVVTSATPYYLNVMTTATAASGGSVATRGDDRTTYMKALCAYL